MVALSDETLVPLPEPVNSPGLGTLTVIVAVPFFLFRVIKPSLKVFDHEPCVAAFVGHWSWVSSPKPSRSASGSTRAEALRRRVLGPPEKSELVPSGGSAENQRNSLPGPPPKSQFPKSG